MRLPRLPSHNNSRAEKSFQAFSSQSISLGWGDAERHQEVRRKSHFILSHEIENYLSFYLIPGIPLL